MLRLGNLARHSPAQLFICASCLRNQNIGRTVPKLLGRPANIFAAAAAARPYSTASVPTSMPAHEPTTPDESKSDDTKHKPEDAKPKPKSKSKSKSKPEAKSVAKKGPKKTSFVDKGENVETEAVRPPKDAKSKPRAKAKKGSRKASVTDEEENTGTEAAQPEESKPKPVAKKRSKKASVADDGQHVGSKTAGPGGSAAEELKANKRARKKGSKKTSVANDGENIEPEVVGPNESVAEQGAKASLKGRNTRTRARRLAKAPSKEGDLVFQKIQYRDTNSQQPASLEPAKPRGRRRRTLGSLDDTSSNVFSFNPKDIIATPIGGEEAQGMVPNLNYGLDRVLFNPGVYQLQDFSSKVYNFDPYLAEIMPAEEFDYNALRQYVTSSQDMDLLNLTIQHKMKYTGSTSSMTSTLSHFHYLLSGFRPPNFSCLSHKFMTSGAAVSSFTRFTRAPVATLLRWKDGAYAIDADKEFDGETVLSLLGRSMEKLFTLKKKDYEKYRKSIRGDQQGGEAPPDESVFHYTTIGDVMMRSQLDAHDSRLPGTGMFDLKTRAVISIRMNVQDYKKGQGYEIRSRFGEYESFEREYHDMIRSAFLKYSLQARMGRMTGIYVAYHNTKRIFGFQYIPLSEMDYAIHGTWDTSHGDREYRASVHLLNAALDKVTARFPQKSLRFFIEARPSNPPFMYIFAKPVTDAEISELQDKAKAKAERIAQKMGDASAKAADDEDEQAGEVVLDEGNGEGVPDEALGNPAGAANLSNATNLDIWEAILRKLCDIRDAMGSVSPTKQLRRQQWNFLSDRLRNELIPQELGRCLPGKEWVHKQKVMKLCRNLRMVLFRVDPSAGYRAVLNYHFLKRGSGSRGVINYVGMALGHWAPRLGRGPNPLVECSLAELMSELKARLVLSCKRDPVHADPWLEHVEKMLLMCKHEEAKTAPVYKSKESKASPQKKSESTSSPGKDDVSKVSPSEDESKTSSPKDEEVLGLILSVRHTVNGEPVDPSSTDMFSDGADWKISYSFKEMTPSDARGRFEMLRARRESVHVKVRAGPSDHFRRELADYNKRGIEFRQKMQKLAKRQPVHVLGHKMKYTPESVFQKPGGRYVPWSWVYPAEARTLRRVDGGRRKKRRALSERGLSSLRDAVWKQHEAFLGGVETAPAGEPPVKFPFAKRLDAIAEVMQRARMHRQARKERNPWPAGSGTAPVPTSQGGRESVNEDVEKPQQQGVKSSRKGDDEYIDAIFAGKMEHMILKMSKARIYTAHQLRNYAAQEAAQRRPRRRAARPAPLGGSEMDLESSYENALESSREEDIEGPKKDVQVPQRDVKDSQENSKSPQEGGEGSQKEEK